MAFWPTPASPSSALINAGASKTQWSRTKRMMQKRHQWEVSDLRKAGLNPILSAGGAPSMGMASLANKPDQMKMETAGLTSRQNKAQRNLMKTQRSTLGSQADLNMAGAAKHRADTLLSQHMGTLAQTNNALAAAGLPRAMLDAEIANSASGRLAAKVGAWSGTIQAAAQGVGAYSLLRMRGGAAGAAAKTGLRKAGPLTQTFKDTGPKAIHKYGAPRNPIKWESRNYRHLLRKK